LEPPSLDRTTCLTLVRSHRGIAWRFGSPFSFAGPYPSPFCIDSSMRSRLPFVHGFPYPDDASGIARRRHTDFIFSMLIPFCLVFRVLSSTLLPALHRPCLLGTPRESATLCPSSLRDLLVESVCWCLWQHQQQDRRASLGKTHHLPISRPVSCQVGSPDIRSRSLTSARPPHQHHLAGSLFATYTGSASCFLQTPHLWQCPCLVGVVLPSGNGGPSCSRLSSGTAACASCQAHIQNGGPRAAVNVKTRY
jgi:hypothetical protein